jgi:glycosyltransferase involved in cell wall biosynthesis
MTLSTNLSEGEGRDFSRVISKAAVVVIGRNEGARLARCLESMPVAATVAYVDSGSTDGSVQLACGRGAEVIELDRSLPFTAARARNAGFRRLRELAPDLPYVQFVDGDCELNREWLEHAASFLESHADVAAVCGRRRERFPERSIYNCLCDREWDGPVGEVRAFGGDVMMRASALEAVGGYCDGLIAGEDPELGVRLRAEGHRIWRLKFEMTVHDAAMLRFSQWWRRAVRAGYAFAIGAYLHGAPPEYHSVWETRRAWLFGIWLPLTCLVIGLMFEPWGWAAWLIYPFHMLQKIVRSRGPLNDRALFALFDVLILFPQSCGAMQFLFDRLLTRRSPLIEYK